MRKMFPLGCRVQSTNGMYQQGVVIEPLVKEQYTDGSYRRPERLEVRYVVYVRWTDGTQGWTVQKFLKRI